MALPLRLTLAVLEALAPRVTDAVGEALSVELAESVEEGVAAGVLLLLPVGVPELLAVGVCVPVALPLRDSLLVAEALAPAVSEAD